MKTEFTSVLYRVENRIASITLNVPKKLNALDVTLAKDLTAALALAAGDDAVKVVVVTGAGRAFCAGGDLAYMAGLDLEGCIDFVRDAQALIGAFTKMPKPVIAAVNGFAVGAGFSLVLLSDIVISSDKAMYGLAFVNIGVIPDLAALYFLPRVIGLQKAKELAFSGKNIDAGEACRLGIVNSVVEHDKLEEEVGKMSLFLAGQPGAAVGAAKTLLNMGMDMGLDELLEMEALAQGVRMVSDDSREGVDAFLNKRKPNFK
ncbi:MAG: enoyl-CoA hydratase/isomerase family protein [Desulfovibrio sp.]|jgi:2-(1,2-epoxy-1,2-dihydrophenyl)acetyl-CoA isomerase|nr:enoyl-CoA hydratase/isomerase family protein [Desulfovibrio sp.]